MSRSRTPFLSGVITNNPLAIGGTTLNSAALASLPVIASPNIAAIVLDPAGSGGVPEVVHVTAHTASATSATILRGQENTTARAHNLNTAWIHAPTTLDFGYNKGADLVSASVLNLPNSSEDYFVVTGTTTIGTISPREGGRRVTLKFSGVCSIVHGVNLKLAKGSTVTTVADQVLEFISEDNGLWREIGAVPATVHAHNNNANTGAATQMPSTSTWYDSGSVTLSEDGTFLLIGMFGINDNLAGTNNFEIAIRNQAGTQLIMKPLTLNAGDQFLFTLAHMSGLSNGNTVKCSARCTSGGATSLVFTGTIQIMKTS